jgi:hypothetical protein
MTCTVPERGSLLQFVAGIWPLWSDGPGNSKNRKGEGQQCKYSQAEFVHCQKRFRVVRRLSSLEVYKRVKSGVYGGDRLTRKSVRALRLTRDAQDCISLYVQW